MPKPPDNKDMAILNMLQDDCHVSHKHIAYTLLTSITAVHNRIRRLEAGGFIRKYVALLDPKKLDRALVVYTQVKLKDHSHAALIEFISSVNQLSDVMECYHLSGDFDFLLRVAVKDMEAYNRFLIETFAKLPNLGVVLSSFVLSEAKHQTAYSLRSGGNSKKA